MLSQDERPQIVGEEWVFHWHSKPLLGATNEHLCSLILVTNDDPLGFRGMIDRMRDVVMQGLASLRVLKED